MDLSICIPTYNRFKFLQWTLERTRRDFPDAEIVVSDNASSDDTRTVQLDPQVRYVCQEANIGPFANFRAALLAGTSKYVCYLADDDYLLPRPVQSGILYLEEHPGVVCYYAPCQLYDECARAVNWNAFYVGEDQTYRTPDALWNFLIRQHVWPEHAIWRREGLESIIKPRLRAYWAFIDLAHAFTQGPVYFASEPFYRNITNHPMGHRTKLGDRQCLTDFDEYRGGLEILAYELFKNHLNPELKGKLNAMIHHFIAMRIGVAHKLLSLQGQAEEAASYEKRLRICA